jgi:pyrroloquinoline-quinone synthase
MDLIERLDEQRARWNILAHPFYLRWEKGELSRTELAHYAGEYRHAVVALARTAAAAAPLAGREHAREEAEHIGLWDEFAAALGSRQRPEPLPETAACVAAWTAPADPLEALAVLYAVEASQPEVSRTKLEGLVEHYGFEASSPGAEYFALHAERDVEHADDNRRLLEEHATDEDADRLTAAAAAALAGNWALLDGVSR